MNDTNRALNRGLLFLGGLVLLVIGAAVALAASWPVAAELWQQSANATREWIRTAHQTTLLGDSRVSWFVVAVLAALVLAVAFAITVMARLGGGRSAAVVRVPRGDDPAGEVIVNNAFATTALTQSLDASPAVLGARVSVRSVRGENVLHVIVTPDTHSSPVEVAKQVGQLIDNLATLTGTVTPACISMRAGVGAIARHQNDTARVH